MPIAAASFGRRCSQSTASVNGSRATDAEAASCAVRAGWGCGSCGRSSSARIRPKARCRATSGWDGVGEDCHEQRRDTVAASLADQAAQLALERNWSICCEPFGEIGKPHRLRLVVLGAMSGDGRVASRHGRWVGLHVLVLRCASHHAAIVTRVGREEKCNV